MQTKLIWLLVGLVLGIFDYNVHITPVDTWIRLIIIALFFAFGTYMGRKMSFERTFQYMADHYNYILWGVSGFLVGFFLPYVL